MLPKLFRLSTIFSLAVLLTLLAGCDNKDAEDNICYTLYEMCVERNPAAPCDDCLRICLNNNEEWPFSKCPIPPRK